MAGNKLLEYKTKRALSLFLVFIMAVSLVACGAEQVKGSMIGQTDAGMAKLDIMPQKLFEIAEIGDTVVVTAGSFKEEMPLVDEIITEEGKLQLFYDANAHSISICLYSENFCETYNVSFPEKVRIAKK